jgi:peroxiredoxin
MRSETVRGHALRGLAILFVLACAAINAAAQPAVRAVLQPRNQRKVAPAFALKDSSGNTVSLKAYQGKVVLLDFWATWCTGCKKEIPWFSEFQTTFGPQAFAVIGVSMDEDGWKTLKPFLAENHVPYTMVLGDEATARQYGIEALPDTFLIDKQGNVAAAYVGGLVDKDNIKANIEALLGKR